MPLSPREGFRRVECACGCGCWFYAPRMNGRPHAYVNAEHYLRERNRRRQMRRQIARQQTTGDGGRSGGPRLLADVLASALAKVGK